MNETCLAVLLMFAPAVPVLAAPFEEGVQLMSEKKYPEAVSRLEEAAHANPGSPEVMLNLGWAYWHAQRVEDAWRVGSTLVKLDPNNRAFLIFLANTDIDRKDYTAAQSLARDALRLAPGDHDAALVLARALLLGGKRTEGAAALGGILARAPGDHDASKVLARALYLDGRVKEAVAVLDKILARFPDDTASAYRRAVFLAELGRKREALSALDGLLSSDPSNVAYRRSRAKILSELGRDTEAKREWEKLARKETDVQSLMNLGWVYWREKNYDAAWEIASTLVKLDDKNPAFLRFMANMEIERMNYPEALRLAQEAVALAPGDRDAELTEAKALFRMQRVREAMTLLQKLIVQYPDNLAVQYRWAEFLGRTGRDAESAALFARLIESDPENETYRLDRAAALYDKGDFDAAVSQWADLAAKKDPNLAAVRRLRDDAANRKDWDDAVARQRTIIADNPSDPIGWEKLSKMFSAMKDLPAALKAAERAISADPVSINGYYMKAEILEQMKDWPAAQAAYEDVVRSNPNSLRAYDGLSYMQDVQGDYRGALKSVRRMEALTAPYTSPFQQIHEASLLSSLGRFSQAHRVLQRLEKTGLTPIPVLLYHGLSPNDRTDSIPQASLRRQLVALKRNGYRTMTVSELDRVFRGKARLPKKPILLTFDDARTDTFENADPVLDELGMRATMFVHVSKLRKPHFHAGPEDIRRWQATGRWEMQAHGYEAHDPMPIDGFGRVGHFLPNRMWLAGPQRLETLAEYRSRIAGEYPKARQGVEVIVPGKSVVAFAYPYGDYGQSDYSNTPEAAAINRALVKKSFHMAFVQGQHGVNSLASNPRDLERFEVPRDMTAEQLMSHLTLNDPRVQAELLEAQMWVQANQLGRAQALYSDLAAQGIEEARIWADEGVAFQKGGDISYAQNLFSRAAAQETDPDGPGGDEDRKLQSQAAHAAEPTASAEVQEFTDSDTNAITKELIRGGGVIGGVRLGGWVGHGDYSDRINTPNTQRIRSTEGGIQGDWFPARSLELDGFYVRREFAGGATGFADNYALAAAYQVLPALKLTLRDGMGNVETALAIQDSVKFHSDGAGAVWDPALNWTANADYDQSRFNDANLEQDIRLRLTKRFSDRVAFGVAYFNGDSTQDREPIYYTPRALNQYTGVLTLNQVFGEANPRTGLAPAEGQIQYEGGYGFQTAGSSMVNSAKLLLTFRPLDRVALTFDAQYAQSPLYTSRTLDAAVKVSF